MPNPATQNDPYGAAFAANPLLIDPQSVDLVNACLNVLSARSDREELLSDQVMQSDDDFWNVGGSQHPLRPYVVKDGVLQIPVQGVLLNRFSYALGRWATGYQYIEKALVRGVSDPNVRAIALVCDSPGGEVAGCFELGDKIYEARGEKPIRAFAANHAYSAAFALASSAGDIVVTRSGGTGSVGVVTAHADFSEALAKAGITVTFIFAGKHKVDGNPYQKLPDAVKARIQERIDRVYDVFTSTVARNRGMEESEVRDTEALTFDAQDSIDRGFADRIGSLDEEMVIFQQEVAEQEETTMTTKNENGAGAASANSITQEQHDAAVATARAEAYDEGVAAERKRRDDIMGSDEAKDRPIAASAAVDAGMTVEAAKVMLAKLPVEKADEASSEPAPQPKGKSPFEQAMEGTENPGVGANAGPNDDGLGEDEKAAQSLVSALKMAGGGAVSMN